jgi:hypothetical protein
MAKPDRMTEDQAPAPEPLPELSAPPVALAQTVADLVAAELARIRQQPPAPPAPPIAAELPELEEDGRIPVTVRLQPFHAEYLFARANAFGETPERMLETILREYRRDDRFRPGLNTAPGGPGAPAGTTRR